MIQRVCSVLLKKSFMIANLDFDEKGCLLVILWYGEQHSTAKLTDVDVHEKPELP